MTSKVFIVTGASKGLGAAVVEHLLAQSHKVVVTARSEDLLRKLKDAHPDQVEYVAGDITSTGVSYIFPRVVNYYLGYELRISDKTVCG